MLEYDHSTELRKVQIKLICWLTSFLRHVWHIKCICGPSMLLWAACILNLLVPDMLERPAHWVPLCELNKRRTPSFSALCEQENHPIQLWSKIQLWVSGMEIRVAFLQDEVNINCWRFIICTWDVCVCRFKHFTPQQPPAPTDKLPPECLSHQGEP